MEKPILFSGEMVRAILDGRKTQTRRVVKPMSKNQAEWLTPELINSVPHGEMIKGGWQMHHPRADTDYMGVHVEHDSPLGWVRCPYGQPGDLLWVRETHNIQQIERGWRVGYYADDSYAEIPMPYMQWHDVANDLSNYVSGAKRRSIFMPRWASRITLRVLDVRVERVQRITDREARAEGVGEWGCDTIEVFQDLWDSINARRGHAWDTNPWVWVVEFEEVSWKTAR